MSLMWAGGCYKLENITRHNGFFGSETQVLDKYSAITQEALEHSL
jgi:hypothetical protein